MPATTIAIVYPQGTKFDMDYYLTKHMPMAQAKWAPYGLKSWKVIQYNGDATYCCQAFLEFDSFDGWTRASTSAEAKDAFDDVPNFADRQPAIMVGNTLEEKYC